MLIEIGPNLTSVLLALVAILASLCSGVVALWTYKAHGDLVSRVQRGHDRIDVVEKVLNGSMPKKEPTNGTTNVR